jgi:hypothetical protein
MSVTMNSSRHSARARGQVLRHARQRVAHFALRAQRRVHVQHEAMEVHAQRGAFRQRGDKLVHQHGLAAPDRTPQVQAARRPRSPCLARAPAGEKPRRRRQQRVVQAIQRRQRRPLGRVVLPAAVGNAARIVRAGRIGLGVHRQVKVHRR